MVCKDKCNRATGRPLTCKCDVNLECTSKCCSQSNNITRSRSSSSLGILGGSASGGGTCQDVSHCTDPCSMATGRSIGCGCTSKTQCASECCDSGGKCVKDN